MTDLTQASPPVCQDYDVDHFDGVVLSLFELFRSNLMRTRRVRCAGRRETRGRDVARAPSSGARRAAGLGTFPSSCLAGGCPGFVGPVPLPVVMDTRPR